MPWMTFISQLAAAAFALAFLIIAYCKWAYTYWEKKNLHTLKPKWLLGNAQNPLRRKTAVYEHIKFMYDTFKRQGAKQCGIYNFTVPIYMPIDPEYIKNVMTRDFSHFVDRGMYFNERDDPLSANLVNIEGQAWKSLRAKLTPTFTSGKMRMMFPVLMKCGEQLLEAVDRLILQGEAIDIKEIAGCYTTDVIGTCAFGLDCNSLNDGNSEFRSYGRKAFRPSIANVLKFLFSLNFGKIARLLRICNTPRDISNFFMGVVEKTVDYREKNSVVRNDFMQILIELKNSENGLSMEQMAAQVFVFFLAGFETSSTTMTFCLLELVRNPDIQEKVRREICDVLERYDGDITYDAIMEMKYMGQVIDETLRKYPSVPILNRKCTKDYTLPETGTVLEQGTRVFIPIYGLHRDPEFYPQPEIFDPDRFNDENKFKRHSFAYIPFGEGPRICIGLRFGLMQTKVGLAYLIKNYKFSLNSKTKLPIQLDPNNFLLGVKDKIYLDAIKIK